MTLSKSLERAIEVWKYSGVELLPAAESAHVRTVMRDIGRSASTDFIQLYEATGGFAGGCDEHIWSLWPLSRVAHVNANYDYPQQIAFSDGLIDSFYYSVRYENEHVSSVWIDHFNGKLERVAESLAEFFAFYLNDPNRINLV